MARQSMLNLDPPESLGDADLLTTLLAAAKVKQPRATANALLAEMVRSLKRWAAQPACKSKQPPTWRRDLSR